MKKFLTLLLSAVTLLSFGCWFTSDNFNGNYLAGVNNYVIRYTEAADPESAIFRNGIEVAFPLTIYVKVSPRNENGAANPIVKAVLQYKILPSGKWVTVKTLENLSWSMNWTRPVALFGRNAIDIRNLAAGSEILIRLYLTDGIYETGDLAGDITGSLPDETPYITLGNGWSAPFVMRIIFNGKRRAR